VSEALRDLATTRLASLCLNRRGRPRGLTFDDHLVRAALVVDLAIGGGLTESVTAVDLDTDRAGQLGLGDVAADLAAVGAPLSEWILRGGIDVEHWTHRLVEARIWTPRRRWPLAPRYDDVHRARTDDDRAMGGLPWPERDRAVTTLAVAALGRVARLFGEPDPAFDLPDVDVPDGWVITGMGDAAWAGSLAVGTLADLYAKLRPGAISLG
jgi:hypothetical protein